MFGRRYYDPYYDRSNGCGCAIALIVLAIIVALLVALLSVGYIILIIGCGIGLIVGLVFSVKAYVKAMIKASKSVFSNRKFTIVQYFKFLLETTRLAFTENWLMSKNAYYKSRQYKLFSIHKWANWVTALSTMICGTLLLLLCVAAHLIICVMLIAILLQLVILVLSIPTVIYSLYSVYKSFVGALGANNPWKINAKQYSTKEYSGKYFSGLFDVARTAWKDNLRDMRSNVSKSHSLKFWNIKKYILFLSPCVMILTEIVLIFIMALVYLVAYLPLLLIKMVFKRK